METLKLDATATEHWQSLVKEAGRAAERELDEQLESYLVFLLMRFTRRPQIVGRILSTDYLRGMQARGRLRNSALRDVGDRCLLHAGLFAEQAKRRMLRVSYFVDLGRSAYDQLDMRSPRHERGLYGTLSRRFVILMDVLQSIRGFAGNGNGLDPLSAFELWCETGGTGAMRTLGGVTKGIPVGWGQTAPATRH